MASPELFEGIIRRSNCRYLVFVENSYDEIRPDIELPEVLSRHLFTGESGLIAQKYVKHHSMVIEIARS